MTRGKRRAVQPATGRRVTPQAAGVVVQLDARDARQQRHAGCLRDSLHRGPQSGERPGPLRGRNGLPGRPVGGQPPAHQPPGGRLGHRRTQIDPDGCHRARRDAQPPALVADAQESAGVDRAAVLVVAARPVETQRGGGSREGRVVEGPAFGRLATEDPALPARAGQLDGPPRRTSTELNVMPSVWAYSTISLPGSNSSSSSASERNGSMLSMCAPRGSVSSRIRSTG